MNEARLRHVGMGELRLGREGEMLTALLGSCVAIGLIWPQGGSCALAHCLLPEAPERGWRMGARYVDHAIPSLVAMMGLRPQDKAEVQVILAGGANMLGPAGISSSIGLQNVAAARAQLQTHGFALTHSDVGGRRGRRIHIDCASLQFAVTKIVTNAEERVHASF